MGGMISKRKIIGGVDTVRNEFPWLVNIEIGYNFCTGSLIDLDLVLTAASCVYQQNLSTISVLAGDHNLRIDEPTEQISAARAVFWHDKYSPETFANDIALIWLTQNLTLTNAVRPIDLPPFDMQVNRGMRGFIAGWGSTSENGWMSDILQKAPITIWGRRKCKRMYTFLNVFISRHQFCADTQKYSSLGDLGAPVLCNGLEVICVCGILSFDNEDFPGVYTRVSSYISWINTHRINGFTPTTSTFIPSSTLPKALWVEGALPSSNCFTKDKTATFDYILK